MREYVAGHIAYKKFFVRVYIDKIFTFLYGIFNQLNKICKLNDNKEKINWGPLDSVNPVYRHPIYHAAINY